jgi:hypothetical protein
MAKRTIKAAAPEKKIIAFAAPVTIKAAEGEGESKGPPTFSVTAYTGGALNIAGWDAPVVIDLAGLTFARSVVANLDHNDRQRVGHVTDKSKLKSELMLAGVFSAATPYRDEVVASAASGFEWEASVEVTPTKLVEVESGKTVTVNGQEFSGPLYVTRKGTLSGFAFVSHGADPNTDVRIAATAAPKKEKEMDPELKKFIEAMLPGVDIETLSEQAIANLKADHEGKSGVRDKKTPKLEDGIAAKQAEADRVEGITEIALNACDKRPYDITAIKKLAQDAIDSKWTVDKFRLELLEASLPPAHTVFRTRRDERLSNRVLEAALCQAGRLSTLDDDFTDQELQAAHDRFPHGISLNQFLIMGAEANGYHGNTGGRVTLEVQRAAFGMNGQRSIHATGFSTIDVSSIVAATANKFLHEGWMAVDMTPLRIAAVRPVRNFQQITTVSLTGHLQFEKVGAAGEIKHGTLGELTYTNQADTYTAMLAITRQDIINDDLGALTAVPKRLGRGGALKLNDIFWTRFLLLVSESFFAAGNSNINTGVADMTIGGLEATETIFMNQTDPDGKPLGVMPKIVLVPTALKAKATALLNSQGSVLITGASATIPDANVFQGRFRVESSPYISNASYTGNTAVGWWMLADPNEVPVIEIAALNGRVEPTVDTADADFNVLGVQMRGYSDIGVREQEKRGGVYADGGAS